MQLVLNSLSHLHFVLPELDYGLDPVNGETGMASATELIVYLEYPSVHVKVVGDELGQVVVEVLLIVDVVSPDGHRNISLGEDPLSSRLVREVHGVWVSREDGHRELNRQLDVCIIDFARHDVALLPVDHLLDRGHGSWRVEQSLRQTEVAWELDVVLWDHYFESPRRLLNLNELEDLLIVVLDVAGERERANVDDVDIGVLQTEDPADLGVFLLLELLDGHSLEL